MKKHTDKILDKEKGQSMFEVVVAIAIAALIVGSSVTAIVVSLRSGTANVAAQKAYGLAGQMLNNVRSYTEANWAEIYNLADKTSNGIYSFQVTATSSESTTLGIATTTEVITFSSDSAEENIEYTTWFSVENVPRSGFNVIGAGTGDPATQKITAHVSWDVGGGARAIELVQYLSKVRTLTIAFDDWSGSSGVVGPVTGPTNDYYSVTNATITSAGDITF
ncbi:MAG: hypothetical protein U1C52_00490 [Patescibacteria group bacterium]|nr:hypothetical protein [Patescibacteria group bacterium]